MTALEINNKFKNYFPFWEIETDETADAENIAYIQKAIDAGLIELYDAMRNDISVMSEHDDDETGLLYELLTADADIITAYKETFL